ncbi:MAG TPA: efflux RND transporter permease subunit [Cycloclasticus sp.]|jgi:multidrug efflux pump|nr:efflux RND transporter permease subunit [Cycloclasticus sp.]
MSDKERVNLARWGIEHSQILIYLMIIILITGTVAFFKLGQRDLPAFAIKTIVVSVKWPGASATDMSQFVTDPIETKLLEVPWLREVSSFSKPGEAWLVVNIEDFMPNAAAAMKDRAYEIRKKIGDIAHRLPTGVQGPFFNDEFGDIFSMVYGFNSDDYSFADIKDYAEKARNALVRIESVEKAILYSVQDEKIFVELDDKRMSALGLDPLQIGILLQEHNKVQNSGRIEGNQSYYRLSLNDRFQSIEDIKKMPIGLKDKSVIYLENIATINRGYEDPPVFRMRVNGKPSIGLGITMRKGYQLLALSDDVKATMAEFAEQLPAGISVTLVGDQPKSVQAQINRFLLKLLIAIFIVLVVCYFSLGLRTGFIVALAIPVVLGVVFVMMYILEIPLTRVSLGALVIALGLLVDDAMIVVELVHVKLEQGWDRLKAATFAYTATSKPMLSGTLIAAVGFLPVYIVNAAPNEILGNLFVVIGVALIASWLVAVLLTPYLSFKLLKVEHKTESQIQASNVDSSAMYQSAFYNRFRRLIAWCMSHKKTVLGATALSFALTIVGMQSVRMEFFPGNDRPEALVDVWFPEGTSYQQMERQIAGVEQLLDQQGNIENYITYVGGDSLRVQNDMYLEQPNANYSKIIVIAKDLDAREGLKNVLSEYFATHQPNVRTRVYNLAYGLPFNYPMQYLITGNDPEKLAGITEQLKEILKNNPTTRDVHDNRREKRVMVDIKLDLPRVAASGTDPAKLSKTLSAMLDGLPVTQYREGNDQIDVVLRNQSDNRYNLDRIKYLQVPLGNGTTVALSELADINLKLEEGVIWRYNGYRSVIVQSLLEEGVLNFDVVTALKPEIDKLRDTLPSGYRVEVFGEVDISKEVDGQLGKTMPFMLVAILTLLMFELNSMKKMALVLMTVPLGLIGVVSILLLLDLSFGLVARLGMLALIGIIIRNTIILMDQIDQDLAAGHSPWDAVLESTVRRARPIILTALAAIFAMIPLVTDYFWGPMAITMMNGLWVATILTIFVFPTMYVAWFKVKEP